MINALLLQDIVRDDKEMLSTSTQATRDILCENTLFINACLLKQKQ